MLNMEFCIPEDVSAWLLKFPAYLLIQQNIVNWALFFIDSEDYLILLWSSWKHNVHKILNSASK